MRSASSARRASWWWCAACLAAVSIPFLVVRFPPITDLPQHAAQIRLLIDALTNPQTVYKVQWLTPYGASFVVLALAWALVGAEHAGRIGFLLIALVWVAAVHWLAWRRNRAGSVAVLASALVFNHTLYWGFFSFLAGWPLFCLWLERERAERVRPFGWRRAAVLTAFAALLYFTHALWFAAAAIWLGLTGLRLPWREQAKRLACLAPLALLAMWWFPHLAQRGFTSVTYWDRIGPARLAPSELVGAALGGIRGQSEGILLAALLAWVVWGWWVNRRQWREAADRELLAAAGIFLLLATLLPYKFENTIRFGHRWMPIALVLLLLGSPAPPWRSALRRLVAMALLVAFVAGTALTWKTFETVELAGLRQSLAALPENPRVMGLSFSWESPRIREHPFIQTFAYAQVLRGGDVNFSFADFAPCLVVFREPRERPWTSGLEWIPTLVRRSDFKYFDYVLVHGDRAAHAVMSQRAPLEPLSAEAPWRLYRVAHPAGEGAR